MSYKIIVSRFNENINWLHTQFENCIIFNKGGSLENAIVQINVGREAYTYLKYIIDNYNHLPDVIVFTQARISDHTGSDDINYLMKMKNEAIELGKSVPNVIYNHNDNKPWYWKPEFNFNPEFNSCSTNYQNGIKISFKDWFVKNINPEYPNPIKIYCNALFAVKKELVISRPIEYYENLLKTVEYHNNPVEAHFLERSWFYIF
jgi:hypothetical protein